MPQLEINTIHYYVLLSVVHARKEVETSRPYQPQTFYNCKII